MVTELGACEAGAVLALLEGGAEGARAAADQLTALYAAGREPWLTRALLHYHARTGSTRALEVLARAPEPHARHLLDHLHDQLRAEKASRHHALAALAPLVARKPAWLRLVPSHGVARELLRAARTERESLPSLHALLALAALVPAAPALAAAYASELAEALVRAATGDAHSALAARALFRAVYATHPCTAVEALRGSGAGEAWERGVAALAAGVRLHPALVFGSRAREAETARWARSEPHDVLAECRRLALPPQASPAPDAAAPDAPPLALPWRRDPPPPGSTAQAAIQASALRPGGEGWFALGDRSGAEAAPHTPLPAEDNEPEPAVEATPENTPRLAFRFPAEGGAARAIGRRASSPPVTPQPSAASARLTRVMAERRAADSPVPFGAGPPPAAARPEPRSAAAPEPDAEDTEVRELTARAAPPPEWTDTEPATPRIPDPRGSAPPRRRITRASSPPRRAASAPPPPARRTEVAVQTVDVWPEPYEFLIADFYRTQPDDVNDQSVECSEPSERLDAYLAQLYSGNKGPRSVGGKGEGELMEQLALAHAQLMYERWRREAHAERNRRLLGRCRQVRALELQNAALQERVRALTRERDALISRRTPAPPAAPDPSAAERALDAALRAERTARLKADAARHEAEAARARDNAELQRTRTETFETTRTIEALTRAAHAADRRAEHIRRLRRELLILAERETRLSAVAAAAVTKTEVPSANNATERALRAAAAKAEAEAEAAGARADAATARAHELETALASRDAIVQELKRATRHAAEESAARTRALRDKYAALLAIVRTREARELERLAAAPINNTAAPATATNCG